MIQDDELPAEEVMQPGPMSGAITEFGVAGNLSKLVEQAEVYIDSARSANTRRSYETGWKIFEEWRATVGIDKSTPPREQEVGLFITKLALSGLAVATIESRVAAIITTCRDRGWSVEHGHAAIRDVLRGIRRKHGAPQKAKQAILGEELETMLGVMDHELRGLRDRAILLVGFAGGLRRSEIVGLDVGRDQTADGSGWIEIVEEGMILHIKGKTGWREVAVGPGSKEATCPIAAVTAWLKFSRIVHGPLFRRIWGKNNIGADRLFNQQVARIVAARAAAAGLRPDLSEDARKFAFAGHSLRAGLATSVDVSEAVLQKHLGHASGEMTRRYKRHKDRFKVNLTKESGL